MPDDVAAQFEVALGLESRPETLGDWIDVTAKRLDAAGISFGVDELCLTDVSTHRATIGEETRSFACVLDTLLLPFILEKPGEVAVQTRSPVSETDIDVTVSPERVTTDPASAVMSFGIAGETATPEDRDGVLAYGTDQFCPYINAFADDAEYEQWSEETNEAVTMMLPLEDGFALAGALSNQLTTDFS